MNNRNSEKSTLVRKSVWKYRMRYIIIWSISSDNEEVVIEA